MRVGVDVISIIIGGSASGKSEYAENFAVGLGVDSRLYIATMQPFDKECLSRIKKHQNMRADKGFTTVEQYINLHEMTVNSEVVLLECLGNLLANEMYSQTPGRNCSVVEHILKGVFHLEKCCKHLIIVTNDVFADGEDYDLSTQEYIRNLAQINNEISSVAVNVTELVFSIPIAHKGEVYKG